MAGQLRLYSLAQPSYAGAFAELGKNDVRATKRILYDMGNFLDANRPSIMAFLCFISDNQSMDMSEQGWEEGRGGHN